MDLPAAQPNESGNEPNLLDYLILLTRYSRLILLVCAAVVLYTYLIFFMVPNKYLAVARLLPPQQNMTLSGQLLEIIGGGISPGKSGGGGLGSMASGLLGIKSPGDLYVGMMTSDTVYDHLVKKFKLNIRYRTKYNEDARKILGKIAIVTLGKKDGIISVEVTETDPKLAAEMANAFIEGLDNLLNGLAVQEAGDRLAFLEKERVQASHKLAKAEEALRKFSEQNSVIQIDTQTRAMLQYIAQIRAGIDAKEVQIQVLRQQATPYNYDIIKLETELQSMKERLHATETQWDQTCNGDVCLPTSKAPALGLDYIRLYREVKFQDGLYQLYTKLAEIARLDLVKDVAVVQVLDEATPPERRSNKRLLPALLAGGLTFIVMVFGIIAHENLRNAGLSEGDALRLRQLSQWWLDVKNLSWLKRKKP